MKKYNPERGSKLLKFFDRYVGMPLVFSLGILKKRRVLPKEIKKIALLKTAAIGDTTILTGVIKDIEEYNENIKMILFTGSSNYEFAKLLKKQFKNLEVVKLPIKNPIDAIKVIKKYECDVFLDFGPWARLNAIFTFFSNSKYTVGFKTVNQFRHYIYDKYVLHKEDNHELDNYKNIIKVIGIDKNNLPQITWINKNIDDKIVTIHMFPGGSRSYLKEWSEDCWIKIINYLTKNDNIVYLTGAKVDKIKAEKIKNSCDDKNKINVVAGEYSLEDTIKLLAKSKLVISIDTGIMHIASALDCNLIALHGPTSSKRWGPLNKNAVSINSDLECAPCLNLGFEYGCNENKCMQKILPDFVIKKIRKFLE